MARSFGCLLSEMIPKTTVIDPHAIFHEDLLLMVFDFVDTKTDDENEAKVNTERGDAYDDLSPPPHRPSEQPPATC